MRDLSLQAVFMGLLAAFAGFISSFAIVQQGLMHLGATPTQAAASIAVLSAAMGIAAIVLTFIDRIPVSVAWSTPGAALLVASTAPAGGFSEVIGAFVVCGLLLTLAGFVRPLARAVAAIPGPLANGLLAGVLMSLCLAPVKAIAFDPWLGLPIFLAWLVVAPFKRILAVPAAMAAFVVVTILGVDLPDDALSSVFSSWGFNFEWTTPSFSFAAIAGIGIPLFIVTMASQNIPGITVLKSNGYPTRPQLWFGVTGLFSLLCAPFGGHALNLSAISAALCAGPESHNDPQKRYWSAITAGLVYVAASLVAGSLIAFVSLTPTVLIQAVAGLALIGSLVAAAVAALEDESSREAAVVTFLFAASGISILGISGAFWGLLAGGLVLAIKRRTNQRTA